VVSPITCFLVAVVALVALFSFRRLGRKERFLLCFGGLPLFGVLGLSLLQRVQPNWPASFYAAGVVLLAAWAMGFVALGSWIGRLRRLFVPGLAVGAFFCVVTHALPFVLPLLGLHGSPLDPTIRLRGWRQLGLQAAGQLAEFPCPDTTLVVATSGRAAVSELAFYLPDQPRVYYPNPTGIVVSQYDIWGGPRDRQGWDAMILTPDGAEVPPGLVAAFSRIESRGEIVVPLGGRRRLHFRVWRGVALRAWPEPAGKRDRRP